MIYLAGPYTHKDPAVVEARYQAHREACIELMKKGFVVFSPIVHGHNLLPELNHWKHDDWISWDFGILKKCDMIYVLKLEGWEQSRGLEAELEFAAKHNILTAWLEVETPDAARI